MQKQIITIELSTQDGQRLSRDFVVNNVGAGLYVPDDIDVFVQDMVDTLLDESEVF